MKLRPWQQNVLDAFIRSRDEGEDTFVFEACPGAGKSYMAAELSWQMLNDDIKPVDLVVCVVPWKSIQGDAESGMIKTFDRRGLRVRERLMIRGARIVQQPVPVNLDAIVTTYSEAMNDEGVDTLAMWAGKGLRIALLCDEIHHANELNGRWGGAAERAVECCKQIIVMSGTFFRTDGKPIKFVRYNDNGRPVLSCPPYKFAEAIRDRCVRPVSVKYTDAELRCVDAVKGEEVHSLSSIAPGHQRLGKIQNEVFHPESELVRLTILDVHEHITNTRKRFRDAACLFTCRPGRAEGDFSGEDRHVHQIAQKIRQYTGQDVVVVSHKDRNATGKIDAFRNGVSPYLVAVNMVSEGVDIPRLRAVAMMRYIQSEMMFRQIVGRAVRMTEDEDGTAAKVFIPKFQLMHEFGMNLEGESLQALKDLECKQCGAYPCVCVCKRCGQSPCVCEGGGEGEPLNDFEVLDHRVVGAGGSVSQDEVNEAMITIARAIMQRSAHHCHANDVQLAHALTLGLPMVNNTPAQSPAESHLQNLTRERKRVNRLMQKIAGKAYGGDFTKAWVECLMKPYRTDWQTVKGTWSIAQLQQLATRLEEILTEAYRNGN